MRIKFPRRTLLELSGATLLGSTGCNRTAKFGDIDAGSSSTDTEGIRAPNSGADAAAPRPADAGTSAPDSAVPHCESSAADIEGPFYRPGMPVRSVLDLYGDVGSPLRLGGVVLDGDCQPVPNAVVELWHASPAAPGSEPGADDAAYDSSATYRYYGQTAARADGRYEFRTLRPGWYLNGGVYRPAHVHVKIWLRGEVTLTTQLYFEDDPFNADDPWFNPEMQLNPDAAGDASFDFVVSAGR